jgi:hypothetical protein
MYTKQIVLAGLLSLAAAMPALAKDRHPGEADPPVLAGTVSQATNTDATSLAASASEYRASMSAADTEADQAGWSAFKGEKAYKRIYGN